MTTLIIGDGPLAYSIKDSLQAANKPIISYVWGEHGPENNPLGNLKDTLNTNAAITIVVEAVIADRQLKREALQQIQALLPSSDVLILTCILNATATEASYWLDGSEQVIGWACVPPLAQREMVEIALGITTDPAKLAAAKAFFEELGKKPVDIQDSVGGVTARVLCSLINNAAFALLKGVASAEDIDKGTRLGTNYPHGPLEWADEIGLDQVFGVLCALAELDNPERYHPAPNLHALVLAGDWGTRTQRGFYPTAGA